MGRRSFIILSSTLLIVVIIVTFFTQKRDSLPEEELQPDKALITGQIIHKSDVQTIPDRTVSRGTILAIRLDNFDQFLMETEFGKEYEESDLWHFQVGVSDEVVSKFLVASSPLNSSGRFSMSLDGGEYFLCLTNTRNRTSGEADWIFQGCLSIEAQEGQKTELNITSAFGGISLN